MLIGDNERVGAGQVLARIDERDFNVALDQAKADVAAAHAAIASKQAQLGVQRAVIDAARAIIDVDTATVTFAAQETSATPTSRRPVLAASERAAGAVA
jgi:membrane fusion protein (multidrug efflux system)